MMQDESLRYTILDPTGNITALVESPVEIGRQSAVAAALMKKHPAVEQVGFVTFAGAASPEANVQAALQMAGGEFCGNASMSAAALYLLSRERQSGQRADMPTTVRLRVSGARRPVEVRLEQETAGSFRAGVHMPPALGIEETAFAFGNLSGTLPVVCMEGISHIIIGEASPFRRLLENRPAAEQAVRDWCGRLAADGLGLMFLEGTSPYCRLTPLVYVPGSGTVFWENSCASGSSAVGMYLAAQKGAAVELKLQEPGGCLRVESDPGWKETWLYGKTRVLG